MSLPNFSGFGDPRFLAELAQEAEESGWDGFFLWDHMLFDNTSRPIVDVWVTLAAAAVSTRRIRLGTLLTPLARRRPWKLARETLTLDHLSGGRLTLGVGLGDPGPIEFGLFHEETDAKIRAEKLDEGLEILNGLWSGRPFHYQGKHYQLDEMTFLPKPVQEPRIPIWVGGFWPGSRPFRRAARFDGVCPLRPDGTLSPDDWRDILAYIHRFRAPDESFDAVHIGLTPGKDTPAYDGRDAAEIVAPYAAAGVTWWIEDISPYSYGLAWDQPWPQEMVELLRNRIHQGPPLNK